MSSLIHGRLTEEEKININEMTLDDNIVLFFFLSNIFYRSFDHHYIVKIFIK